MMKLTRNHLALTALICTLLASCKWQDLSSDISDLQNAQLPNWQGEFAVPVLNAELDIQDFLDEFSTGGFIRVEPNGEMTLVYRGEVFSTRGKDLFAFPSIATLPVPSHTADYPVAMPNGMRIDRIGFKQATFDYSFVAPGPGTVRIIVPSITQGATVFDQSISVSAADTFQGSFPLAGWALDITNGSFQMQYTVDGGTTTSLSDFFFGINNIQYKELRGYFGDLGLTLPKDTIALDLFLKQQSGRVNFIDPRVSLEVTNSYGFPLLLKAESFNFVTKYSGSLPLSQQLTDGILFDYPTVSEIGQSKVTTIILDTATSNLAAIISGLPQTVEFGLKAGANPNGDTGEANFLVDTSNISVVVDVQFPLKATISEFVVNQDFAFTFAGYDLVQSGAMRLVTQNEFPFDLGLQVILLDSNGVEIDSLFTAAQQNNVPRGKILLKAANVDAQGRSTGPQEAITDFVLDVARIEKLKQTRKIRMRLAFATVENGTKAMSIFADYGLNLRMGLVGKANMKIGG